MKTIRHIVFIGFLILSIGSTAQEFEIAGVLDSTRAQLSQIVSYSVDATFKVDIDFVNMPDKNARIHFTAPDKLDIESDGFLMIPKIGMKPMMKQLDIDRYHAVYVGEEEVNDANCYVVKMIPKNRNNKIVLSTLWIRQDDYLVLRWEFFTKKAGNMIIDLYYDSDILPSQMIFSFELNKMNIPLKYFGNEVEIDDQGLKSDGVQKGKVFILFENYQINYSQNPGLPE